MKKQIIYIKKIWLILLILPLCLNAIPKIVGLIQVRNEEQIIEQCLRALALYTDAIVVLDDGSFDTTLNIVKQLQQELHIETIIEHKESTWRKETEAVNRQSLLDAGRAINGTHFIIIDSDEMFMATCLNDNWLRTTILSLNPGQVARFPMVNMWDGTHQYRDDDFCGPHMPKWKAITCALCDDGICNYYKNTPGSPSGTIHVAREPFTRNKTIPDLIITDLNHGIMHFKCTNLENIAIKRVWYMCLEYIASNVKSNKRKQNAEIINSFYNNLVFKGLSNNIERITVRPVPDEWYAGYTFFDRKAYEKLYIKKKEEVLTWLNTYGPEYFAHLAIWDVDWLMAPFHPSNSNQ